MARVNTILDYCIFFGHGISSDYKQAINWHLKAAHNGDTKAMSYIGFMYCNGKGVTANIRTVIEWYTKAANQGHPQAQYSL